MDTSGIFNQIKTGTAFKNPLAGSMNDLVNKTAALTLPELTALAEAQALAKGVLPPTSTELSAALTSLANAGANAQGMLKHSNMLSGVDMQAGNTIHAITSIANAAKVIEKQKGCDVASSVLGSLKDATNTIKEATEIIGAVDKFLADIPGTIASVPAMVETFGNKLKDKVVKDTAAIAKAQLTVQQHALAASLVQLTKNECFSNVFSGIMSDKLKAEVQKEADKVLAKKLISVKG